MAMSIQSASASRPSSAESSARRWKYDVFLSFRGEDTRRGLASLIYHKLQKSDIKTFMDDTGLETGEPIAPSLLKAIEESRSAIVVLSPNYASSKWCLEELTMIVQCKEDKNMFILPIFYGVEPSDVRFQKRSFEEAFTRHEQRISQDDDVEKAKQWRAALKKVADLSGLDSKNYGSDRLLIKAIIKAIAQIVCGKVQPIKIGHSMSTGDFVISDATRQTMDEVMNALKDDKVTSIGVYGMGGVGKTTMVKHVGAQSQKLELFDQVIMAVVTQSPDLINIQGTLAELLRLKLDEKTEIGRAAELKKKIVRGNRILIILDDIWDKIDLSTIGIPSYEELRRCHSKVLLTTRRLNVCHSMETQASIRLDVLSEEDSWNLFMKKAKKPLDKSTEYFDVARKVARECRGLPIALIAVAKVLGDKDIEDWKEAAQRLERSQTANHDDQGDVSKCIKLSYDYLSGDAKSFFLLCCLFPEDEDIQIADLVKYGFGKGLFPDANKLEEARGIALSLAKHLKASNLLLDSTKHGCIRMHDVIRDTAISIASSERSLVRAGCKLKVWPRSSMHEDYQTISLMRNRINKLPDELVCSNLQILLLQENYFSQIPENFFRGQSALRVLDVSNNYIYSLPASLGFLVNLQALYLDNCSPSIGISILGKLKKLEILSMRKTYLKKLPEEIGDLTNLRMLDVTAGNIDGDPSNVISRLSTIEELHLQCDFGIEEAAVEEDRLSGDDEAARGELNHSFHEFVGLKFLTVLKTNISGADSLPNDIGCFSPNWVNFNISFCQKSLARYHWEQDLFLDDYSRTLTLDTTVTTLPNWFIEVVTAKTEKLQYVYGEGLSNLLVEHDHGRLQNLKFLSLIELGELEESMNTTTARVPRNEPIFEKLEVLYVYCSCLEELCVGELPHGSLRNLKLLNVTNCDMVNAVVPSNLLQSLHNLETIICKSNYALEYLFGTAGIEPEQNILTNLREIILSFLPSLLKIWNGPALRAIFSNLNFLEVEHCGKLKHLFTFAVAQCLLQLEHLWVITCSGLERVLEPSRETEINKVVIPKLKGIVLKRLPQLIGFNTSTSRTSTIDHIECPLLEHLYVEDCPQFSTSASDFHSRKQVQRSAYEHFIPVNSRWLPYDSKLRGYPQDSPFD